MGNRQRDAIIHLYCSESVSLCPATWVGTKGECQIDGGSASRLFLLSQTRELRRTRLSRVNKGFIIGETCVSKKKTQIKAQIGWGRVIREEESCLSITNKTCPYALLGPLAYANRWKKAEGFFSPAKKTSLFWSTHWKCSWQRCFCAAELTLIITDGPN